MWFKNLMIYRLSGEFSLSADEMEKRLSAFLFTPCGSQELSRTGWVAPSGAGIDTLVLVTNGQMLISARKEEKILPASVIRQALAEKIEKIESEQQRKLKKKEKETLKEEVIHSLLPRAFSRFSQTSLWIDTQLNLIFLDCASAKKAEDTLALLRKCIGSLPVVPLAVEKPVELTLTEWVRSGNMPAGFVLMDEAELKAILEEGGVIRCKNQDLTADEISHHIEAGKVVTKLALDWQERIKLLLANDGSLKRLKFDEKLREQNDDIASEDFALRFNADFILMTAELSALVTELIVALGGEVKR